ncbi:MAG: hypothetical protein AB7V08_04945 [Elusimicrobiales bacterium]
MGVKPKLMKRGDGSITYSLPSIKMLSEKLVDSLEWPEDKIILAFRFPPERAPKGVPIQDMVSRRKYLCRATYIGTKSNIPDRGGDGAGCGLKLAPFRSKAEYGRVYLRSYAEDYLKPFCDYQERGYEKENKEYFKKQFPNTKGISVRKDGRVVAMLCVKHMPENGRPYRPLSWIDWLWVDGSIPKDERKAAHGLLGKWLKKLPGKYFGGAIHAVNMKSQNWFIRMGARPVQIFFLRR